MGINKTNSKFEIREFCDNPECSYMEINKIVSAINKKAARETAILFNRNPIKKRCPSCNSVLVYFAKSL